MALITPEGKITYYPPASDGLTTQFGYARDWRLSKEWIRQYCEWIEPLGAIAPVASGVPQACQLSDFTVDSSRNTCFRDVIVLGNPSAAAIEFYDGDAYSAEDSYATTTGTLETSDDWAPRFALHLIRQAPPPDQACWRGIVVELSCSRLVSGHWTSGKAHLYLPLKDDNYPAPFLHAVAPEPSGDYSVMDEGDILSYGPGGSSLSQGQLKETWFFEYEEIWKDADGAIYGETAGGRVFQCSHVLIRNSANPGQWWHYQSDELKLSEGKIGLSFAGSVCVFNLSPLVYGEDDSTATAPEEIAIPTVAESTWNSSVNWDGISSVVTGWSTSVAGAGDGTNRPTATIQRTNATYDDRRPILWWAYEEHQAVIGNTAAGSDSTDGDGLFLGATLSQDWRWKGAMGAAQFAIDGNEPYSSWDENGKIVLEMGWNSTAGTDLAAETVCTHYIAPEGITIIRDGEKTLGYPELHLEFGDFAATRMRQKDIIDMGQAGGHALACASSDPCTGWDEYCWLHNVGTRMGLPYSMIDHVDDSLAALCIPHNDLPSLPILEARDGESWEAHIRAVEDAMGVRVCFDKDANGHMSVDEGPEEYVSGTSTIAFSIDYDTLTASSQVDVIEHTPSGENFRNLLKAAVGPPEDRKTAYVAESLGDREAGIGDDWPRYLEDDDAGDTSEVVLRWKQDHYRWESTIRFVIPLRVGLKPDEFVQITDCPDMRLPASGVYQVVSCEHVCDAQNNEATTTVTAVLKWDDGESALQSAAVFGMFAADLDLVANGGLMQ